jgi:hypothetical protein|tara:strand:- start:513 stop:689 length:177 start_codon:yes stop_codon:yes gene_type:complete
MTRKSAAERIDSHEKLCKIMQKQTFTEIREIKERILRLEKMILGAAGAVIIALLINNI